MSITRHYNNIIFHNINLDSCNKENHEELRMRSLWRSVITQAMMDAANNSKKKQAKMDKIHAIEWLKGNSDDFIDVCMLADMDPDYVRVQALAAMNRGCKWRNDLRAMLPITID